LKLFKNLKSGFLKISINSKDHDLNKTNCAEKSYEQIQKSKYMLEDPYKAKNSPKPRSENAQTSCSITRYSGLALLKQRGGHLHCVTTCGTAGSREFY